MDGIQLHRSEYVVLLDAMKASAIVGLDNDALLPKNRWERQQLLQEGIARLQQREWLYGENGQYVLHGDLMRVASVVAFPRIVFLTIRDTPGVGKQQFLHYQAGPYIVEQTMPASDEYRMAVLADLDALIQRIGAILPIISNEPDHKFTLPEADFLLVNQWLATGELREIAQHLSSRNIAADAIRAFVDAAANPSFSGTVAVLSCQQEQITDARNLALIVSPQTAWMMHQAYPDLSTFIFIQINANMLNQILTDWFQALSQ